MYSFKELKIYQEAMAIAEDIWKEFTKWDYNAKDTVGRQLVRSADSIAANIAEGYGRHHTKDSTIFFYYSRGSILETRCWIEKAKKRTLLSVKMFTELDERLLVLEKMLNAFITSYRSS